MVCSRTNPNYHYIANVPQGLRKNTAIYNYDFLVSNPSHSPFKYVRNKTGGVERIPDSAYCAIDRRGRVIHLLIEKREFPVLYDSILAIGSLRPFTPYINRYMKLYKSYESLTKNIDIEFRAIRHGISHSTHALSNSRTVKMLEKLFGTKHIDLSKRKQVNVFYQYFAKLMIAHDRILHKELMGHLNSFRTLNEAKDALYDWVVEKH